VPEYNTLKSGSEGQKKQFQALATTPTEQFKLIWERMSDADYLTLVAHYNSCYGEGDSFSWTGVPSYIDTNRDGVADGLSMTGRWVEGSLYVPDEIGAYDMGTVSIIFEKSV